MNKLFSGLVVLIAIMSLPTVTADSLDLLPQSLDANVLVGVSEDFSVQLHNTHSFTIYNITFTPIDGVTFPTITSLNSNETRDITVTVLSDESESISPTSTVEFFFLEEISQDQNRHFVNITDSEFTPDILNIIQNDFVEWRNVDTISHRIVGSSFDVVIPVNGTFEYQFLSEGLEIVSDNDFPFIMLSFPLI